MNKRDFRTNRIYLETIYECGCVSETCPPVARCTEHDKPIKVQTEKQLESSGKELKQGQEEAPEVKPLGVGVSDDLGKHWADKVN